MADLAVPRLSIGADVMQEAAEAGSFRLKVPERAKKTAKNAFWTELFTIVETSMAVVEDVDAPEKVGRIEVIARFKVAAESEYPENVGKTIRMRWLLNPTAQGKSKERTMHILSLSRIRALLAACGVDVDAGLDDLRPYFMDNETEGTDAAIKNMQIYGTLKDYKDKDDVSRQDVIAFLSLEAGPDAA